MNLEQKQAKLTVLQLNIEALQNQYQSLKIEVVKEMNEQPSKKKEPQKSIAMDGKEVKVKP